MKNSREVRLNAVNCSYLPTRLPTGSVHHKVRNLQPWLARRFGHEIAVTGDWNAVLLQ